MSFRWQAPYLVPLESLPPARSSGDLVCESKSWNESRGVTEKTKISYGIVTSHMEP